ncbi:N-methyl-L-tryptophan oxidase [soil metagenome]
MRGPRVIVVGAGVMGAATAYALALRGIEVTLVEQFSVGHTRGSSHGRSRIFRLSYPDPMYVAMAQEAMPLWRRLERAAREPLMLVTGGFDLGAEIEANARSLAECGAPFELLSGREAAERCPLVAFPPDCEVLYQRDGAVVLADRALRAFLNAARGRGAHVVEKARVDGIAERAERVEVTVGSERLSADLVVLTTGAWAPRLLADLGIEHVLRPTRETVSYFHHDAAPLPALAAWGNPAVYALQAPGEGLKAGEHSAGTVASPDEDGAPDEGSVARVSEWVRRWWPGADPSPHRSETCFYTNTPDEHFLLERHGRVVVGSPCSGHGFKFAPLTGERLADLALA